MKKSKLLFVTKSLGVGGVERKIVKLSKHLNYKKFDVGLFLFSRKGLLIGEVDGQVKKFFFKSRAGLLSKLFSFYELKGLIDKEGYDCVFVFGDLLAATAYFAKVFSKKRPSVIVGVGNVMSEWVKYNRYSWLRNFASKFIFSRVERIIAVSNAVKKDLVKNYFVDENKIDVIYNFVEEVHKRDLFKGSDDMEIIYVGRLVRQKRVDLLIKSLPYISAGISKLVVVGDGPEKKKLKNLANSLGVKHLIEFVGSVLNPEEYVARASLLVLCSGVEGYPNTILEAMNLGTPVLVTGYPGATEIVEDGKTGFLVKRHVTPKELAGHISRALKDKKLLVEVASKARNFVQKFKIEDKVKDYERVLSSCC